MPVDLKELRQLSAPELVEKEKQLVQELFNLRFQLGTGRLENPMQLRKAKRDLARIKTVRKQLELSQTPASSGDKR
jgi:large subunit ribosomal protein L29